MNKWVYNNDPNIAFPYECPYCGCGHSFPMVACDRCGKIVNPLTVEEKKIPKEKWLRAFGQAVKIAIEKDYFSDILEFDLFHGEIKDYKKAWAEVETSFKEIFGYPLY